MNEQFTQDDGLLVVEQTEIQHVISEHSGLVFVEQKNEGQIELQQDKIQTVVLTEEKNIFVEQRSIEHVIFAGGDQGPQGPKGEAGDGVGNLVISDDDPGSFDFPILWIKRAAGSPAGQTSLIVREP